ncbi:uncharacterized protein si:dkey-219e21.4 [Girardinichthys multiradiatus]|uniref:uncharacterized protein si:dkey-219e21.4 n=1 Tax=Girardinichthys multiradiatus TaxID=208333 RepID=UPI001FACFDC1|nr:uncharacterized protein si:dkey-219e21.4 [Girardinichthys multiradiatus]XP_047242887.1 uncharacterized protein si:dkey-219e21.4 [Girardinichthys multiradiatus]
MELKRIRTRLDQILKSWVNHQEQLLKSISIILGALNNTSTKKADKKGHLEIVSPKRADAPEREIKLNDKRFEKLLKTLYSISNNLKAQLQRKTALLDSYPTVIDKQTCHSQITVNSEGQAPPTLSLCAPLQRILCSLIRYAVLWAHLLSPQV